MAWLERTKRIVVNLGIYPDLLHIADLALYRDLFAGAYWCKKRVHFPEKNLDMRLQAIYARYIKWCQETGDLICIEYRSFVGVCA